MATSNSSFLHKMSGQIGKELLFKQWGDKTIVCKYPDFRKRKLSKKQKQITSLMTEANYEAKRIMADQNLRAEAQVRLNVTSNKLYTALIRDYFKTALATS